MQHAALIRININGLHGLDYGIHDVPDGKGVLYVLRLVGAALPASKVVEVLVGAAAVDVELDERAGPHGCHEWVVLLLPSGWADPADVHLASQVSSASLGPSLPSSAAPPSSLPPESPPPLPLVASSPEEEEEEEEEEDDDDVTT